LSTIRLEDDDEYRYFELFTTHTYYEAFPFYDPSSVECPMFMEACSVDAIRKSIIAIGALHKATMVAQDLKFLSLDFRAERNPSVHHQNAIKYYSEAICDMRKLMTRGVQDLRITLISCLTIFMFEAFHGNFSLADAQIHTGISLIRDWMKKQPNHDQHALGFSSPAPLFLEDKLIQLFGQLEVQTIVFRDNRSFETHDELRKEGTHILQAMPQKFASLEEAQVYLHLVMRRFEHFLAVSQTVTQMQSFPESQNSGVENAKYSQSNLFLDYATHQTEFDLWNTSFQLFVEHHDENDELRKSPFARTLYLHFKISHLAAICTIATPNETVFDVFTTEFWDIVVLSEELYETLASKSKMNFTFDSGVIVPLYIVGMKCRVPAIRRRAIDLLLSHPRREGLWDSVLVGRVSAWTAGIEEESLEDGYVPVWARMNRINSSFDLLERVGVLSCSQTVRSGEGFVTRERSTTITW
jgi:hypothetical protein